MTSTGRSSDLLDYDGFAEDVEGLGPGSRAVLWLRGCERRCPGCIAPELWAPGTPTPIEDAAMALAGSLGRDGNLTITGGEPFLQSEALIELLEKLGKGPEVLIYSGYVLDELVAGPPSWRRLLSLTDILIDGPFMENEPNTLMWRGSDNQRVHLLSERAQRHTAAKDAVMPASRPFAVQMLSPARYRLIGIPKRGDLANLRTVLAARGLEVSRQTQCGDRAPGGPQAGSTKTAVGGVVHD